MEVNFTIINLKVILQNSDIEMYSANNEKKSVVAERFIETLKNKIYKHMTIIGKNVYFDVLDDIAKDYNITIHNSTKMKPKDVKDDSFIEPERFPENIEDPKFKIGDHVRISKYKNSFSKGYTPNWSEEILINNKIQKNCSLDLFN